MKFSSAIIALASLAPVSANMSIRNPKAAAKVLRESRRLEQGYNQYNGQYNYNQNGQQGQNYGGQYNQMNDQYQQGQYQQGQYNYNGQGQNMYYGNVQDSDYPFLAQYSIKLIGCFGGLGYNNPENYEYEASSVVYRLCPVDSCDSYNEYGCDEGYGDYVVGLQTFIQAYSEAQRENNNNYNNYGYYGGMDIQEYMECKEFDMGDQNNYYNYNRPYNQYNDNGNFFIGPTCAADGVGVALGLYIDEQCSQTTDVPFEYLSGGSSLPFADGGLVSNACTNCMSPNNNGEYEISEFCEGTYMSAGTRCEANMESSYMMYSSNNGCETIEELIGFSKSVEEEVEFEKSNNARKIFVVVFGVALVAAIAGYVVWWRKKKAATSVKQNTAKTTKSDHGTMA